MPHINFNPDSIDWREFFAQPQVGGSYFQGVPYMRGSGVGSIFRSLYRYLLPITKSIGKEVGREGLSVGARVLGDLAKGEEPKQTIATHSREGLRNLLHSASDKLQKGSGKRRKSRARSKSKKQYGHGTMSQTYNFEPRRASKRKRTRSASSLPNSSISGRSVFATAPKRKRKKKRVDSLGTY